MPLHLPATARPADALHVTFISEAKTGMEDGSHRAVAYEAAARSVMFTPNPDAGN